jgi:serine/threonine protein kinase
VLVAELCGTMFTISGIVNTDKQVLCDNFTADFLLRDLGDARLEALTRKLVALRAALLNLYAKSELDLATSFSYVTSFRAFNNQIAQLQYINQIKPKLYLAKMNGVDVIVKFTGRYGVDVHMLCARQGFAPEMYGVERIAPDHWMIVMQKINCRQLVEQEETQELKPTSQQMLDVIHTNGYVHGDFRANNILMEEGSGRLFVVDFDWSGKIGDCKYPVLLNRVDLVWPDDAAMFKPILPDHDKYWMNRICSIPET